MRKRTRPSELGSTSGSPSTATRSASSPGTNRADVVVKTHRLRDDHVHWLLPRLDAAHRFVDVAAAGTGHRVGAEHDLQTWRLQAVKPRPVVQRRATPTRITPTTASRPSAPARRCRVPLSSLRVATIAFTKPHRTRSSIGAQQHLRHICSTCSICHSWKGVSRS